MYVAGLTQIPYGCRTSRRLLNLQHYSPYRPSVAATRKVEVTIPRLLARVPVFKTDCPPWTLPSRAEGTRLELVRRF
jgi:hypothetical protein